MSGIMLGTVLTPGWKYRLRSQSSQQRYPREAVMTFLGMDGDNYFFSARPVAGTQTLNAAMVREVILVEHVNKNTEHYLNKIIRES